MYESKLGYIRPSWYVFPFANRRRPVDPLRPATTIKSAWQSLKAELGIDYRLHNTRHTVATALAEADVSEAEVLYLMGHVDKKVIKRYTHLEADECRPDLQRALANRRSPKAIPTADGKQRKRPA